MAKKQTLTRDQHIKQAADVLSDLNTFAIVVSILEGGHTHAFCQAEEFRIIKIAQAAQSKLLDIYDFHREAANQ